MFSKILVANRGIISASCVQAAREAGAEAAVLYLPQDKRSFAEMMADEVYELNSPDPAKAYYDVARIADLAQKIGADAVHPGYGFLAGNTDFQRLLEEREIALIGLRSTKHTDVLSSKPRAKAFAEKLGIRAVPGSDVCTTFAEVEGAAKKMDYPVVLKPASGAGGRGMRIVARESELESAYGYALSRAERFGVASAHVFVEEYLKSARHLEFPVLRDDSGNIIVLPEVESSIQRRFQKLLMETPSAVENRALVKQLAGFSRRLVERLEMVGFASVEYLVDGDKAYFLEINNYVQPSHAATTELTGIDLIKEQIRVCSGEDLLFGQEDVFAHGRAMSVFVNAEDPLEDFAPSPGVVHRFELRSGAGIRVHSTLASGDTVSSLYDPVLAQVVAVNHHREDVIRKLSVALSGFIIEGVKTNLPFLRSLLEAEAFVSGDVNVSFLSERSSLRDLLENMSVDEEEEIAALIAALTLHNDVNSQKIIEAAAAQANQYSIWNFTSRLLNRNKMEF